jgi:CubicO group peptidase (beta-lactamase class C family)
MPGHYCARGKMKRHAVVALFLLISSVCFTQVKPEQIDAIFRPLTDDQSPGLSVGVIHDGKLVFARGYGLANVAQRTLITPDTDFRLASVTKQFTAMSIMLLVHDGKLRYDDSLTKIFPEFPPYGKDITVRQLLNHTSGLKDYGELYVKQVGEQTPMDKVPQILDKGVLQLLEQQTTTDFPPGSKWMYSNSGYAVLAMIVEKASGKPFGDFLHDRIFKPLQMDKTVAYEKRKNEVPNRAFGYRKDKKTGEVAFADQSPTSAVLGDGGIYTSVKEMAKWDKALREHKLLSEAEMREAFTPVQVEGGVKFEDGKELAYGFGWFLNPYKGHEREWHDGGTMGFLTTIQRFPKDGLTVVVLSNRMDLDPGEQALKVADLYLK